MRRALARRGDAPGESKPHANGGPHPERVGEEQERQRQGGGAFDECLQATAQVGRRHTRGPGGGPKE